MSHPRMHADELAIDVDLVRRLLARQFPRWAGLPIRQSEAAGTDNAIYRLGEDMAARLPRIGRAAGQVDKEHQWLPRLAQHLPLAVPVPMAKGMPGEGYPWNWSIVPWIEGEPATIERLTDPRQAVVDLARFIVALQRIDGSGGPPPGDHNFMRGVPLTERDKSTREAIMALHGMLDVRTVTAAWDEAVDAPAWQQPPVWIHGDLSSGNLLALHGQLHAVIDFGGLAVGDPSCDLMIGWTLFTGESRRIFRAELSVDDATWARGRGWALSWALIYIPYYLNTNPVGVKDAWRTIGEVLADARSRVCGS